MKAESIQAQLDGKRQRLGELQGELSAASAELTTTRARHIKGEIKTGDVVQANLLYDTLKDSISTLQGEITQLEGQYRAAVEMERKAAHRGAIAKAAQEATAAAEELNQVRREAWAAVAPVLEKANALRDRHTAAREQAIGLLGQMTGHNLFTWFLSHGNGSILPIAKNALQDIEREYGVSAAGVHAITNPTRQTIFDNTKMPHNLEESEITRALATLENVAKEDETPPTAAGQMVLNRVA